MIPGQRDLDSIQILRQVRDDHAALKASVVSRWGRVPIIGAAPATTPPDGSIFVRSDVAQLEYRSGGVTYPAISSAGFRRINHNGDMSTAQRGTSATGVTTAGYRTVDRWRVYAAGIGTAVWTEAQVVDGPAGTPFTNSWKITTTTGSGAPVAGMECNFGQIIEGVDLQHLMKGTSAAMPFVVGFWIKASIAGIYNCEAFDPTSPRSCAIQYTVNNANTWEYKLLVFPPDTGGSVVPNTTAAALTLQWMLGNGSAESGGTYNPVWQAVGNSRAVGQTNVLGTVGATWQITGIQFEAGTVPTPWEAQPYGVRLALCQRYFWRMTAPSVNAPLGVGFVATAAQGAVQSRFPVTMRIAPSGSAANLSTTYCTDGAVFPNPTGISFDGLSVNGAQISLTGMAGLTVGRGALWSGLAASTATVDFTADL